MLPPNGRETAQNRAGRRVTHNTGISCVMRQSANMEDPLRMTFIDSTWPPCGQVPSCRGAGVCCARCRVARIFLSQPLPRACALSKSLSLSGSVRSSFSRPAWFFSRLTRKVFDSDPDSDFDVLSQLRTRLQGRPPLVIPYRIGYTYIFRFALLCLQTSLSNLQSNSP